MVYLLLFFIFLLGLTIGSFINCLIWRLHKKEGLWNRSYCPKCRKMIAWFDNIPVFSYLMLRARCRNCKKTISWQYPAVELVTGALFVLAFILEFSLQSGGPALGWQFSNPALVALLRDWFIISVMIIIFIYDLRWYLILDIVTLPACAVVFVFNLLLGFSWLNLLISGIIGGSFFLLQFLISRGKWIGGGDIRLGLLMGLALGWPMVIVAIMLAYLIGSVISICLILGKKKQWGSQVPLGIFLSTATVIILLWGEGIVNWYFRLLM